MASIAPWPAQNTRSPARSPGCTGPTAAGAFEVEIALTGHVAGPSSPVRMVVAMIDGGSRPIDGDRRPSSTASSDGGRRGLRLASAKDRASRASARSRTARSAGRGPASAPGERRRAPARPGPPPATGRWPRRGRRPAPADPSRDRPLPSSWARCADVIRTDAVAARARRRTPRRHRACGPRRRRHEQDARVAVDAAQRA